MKVSGNLRKMRTQLENPVQYFLPLYDVLEEKEIVPLNEMIGKTIRFTFEQQIHCVVSGKKIKKAYGEGLSYEAFIKAPQAVESIIRPELSQAHLGIALRDLEWEVAHDVQPHVVYLALTNGVKVGVTRLPHIPARWIDQGAWKTIILAETPYRQAAGLIEVALKPHMADRTDWRKMLCNEQNMGIDLLAEKNTAKALIPNELQEFISDKDSITEIHYPVLAYPEKVNSLKLDKVPEIQKTLVGIKGQYWLFEDGAVINIRSHAGYCVSLEV
jgi:hypothetical protein